MVGILVGIGVAVGAEVGVSTEAIGVCPRPTAPDSPLAVGAQPTTSPVSNKTIRDSGRFISVGVPSLSVERLAKQLGIQFNRKPSSLSEKDFGSFQRHLCKHSYRYYSANLAPNSSSKTSEVWQNSLRQTASLYIILNMTLFVKYLAQHPHANRFTKGPLLGEVALEFRVV